MAHSVYLASTEGHAAKSTVALGLLNIFATSVERTAVFRPLVRSDSGRDAVLDLLLPRASAGLAYEDRIRRLARWVDEAERDGRRYRLQLPGRPPLGPDAGVAHRHACLRALALLPEAR